MSLSLMPEGNIIPDVSIAFRVFATASLASARSLSESLEIFASKVDMLAIVGSVLVMIFTEYELVTSSYRRLVSELEIRLARRRTCTCARSLLEPFRFKALPTVADHRIGSEIWVWRRA